MSGLVPLTPGREGIYCLRSALDSCGFNIVDDVITSTNVTLSGDNIEGEHTIHYVKVWNRDGFSLYIRPDDPVDYHYPRDKVGCINVCEQGEPLSPLGEKLMHKFSSLSGLLCELKGETDIIEIQATILNDTGNYHLESFRSNIDGDILLEQYYPLFHLREVLRFPNEVNACVRDFWIHLNTEMRNQTRSKLIHMIEDAKVIYESLVTTLEQFDIKMDNVSRKYKTSGKDTLNYDAHNKFINAVASINNAMAAEELLINSREICDKVLKML